MISIFRIVTMPISFDKLLAGQMKFMQQNGCRVTMISSSLSKLEKLSVREGCDYFAVSMTRQITPFKDLKALYNLYRLIKQHKPHIVHTHTPKAGLIGMAAAWLAGTQTRIHTVAGIPLMETRGIKKMVLKQVERFTYACSTQVYANSFKLADYMVNARFCKVNKVKVLGNGSSNGIDIDYFKTNDTIKQQGMLSAEKYNIKVDDFVFVFIGRVVTDKGINELVKAFKNIYTTNKNVKLLLVGPYEEDLDPVMPQTKDDIANCEAIIHAGYKDDIRPFLAIAHVLVFPSYREGFPNVPMQAGCFNVPCIVTDINGCNEIVKHGINGLIVPPKNVAALQQAMEQMLNDSQLRETCAKNARGIITSSYSNSIIWHELLAEYNRFVKTA